MRPTVADLADAAGVSTATVDRVLNGRAGVSARTTEIVTRAARQIGYIADVIPNAEPLTVVVLLPAGPSQFMTELRTHFVEKAATMDGVTLELPEVADMDPRSMAGALDRVGDVHGLAVVAQSHPLMKDAIQRITARNIPVVTLLSDLPDTPRLAYVGVDNLRAGRLAAEVITRFLGPNPTGKVAFFAGSLSYRGHQEREVGLRQYLAEEAPGLTLLEVRESGEDRERAHALTREKLAAHPDICAIYNAGSGTHGIARALQETGRADDIITVAHEATTNNNAFLLDGTLDAVIDQNAKQEAIETLEALVAAARSQTRPATPPRLSLILKENIPYDLAAPHDKHGGA